MGAEQLTENTYKDGTLVTVQQLQSSSTPNSTHFCCSPGQAHLLGLLELGLLELGFLGLLELGNTVLQDSVRSL